MLISARCSRTQWPCSRELQADKDAAYNNAENDEDKKEEADNKVAENNGAKAAAEKTGEEMEARLNAIAV